MSLPAYLFLYDENGGHVKGDCMALGCEGAIEIMNTQHGISLSVDPHSGSMAESRLREPMIINKWIYKSLRYLFNFDFTGKRLKTAILRWYAINDPGVQNEIYNLIMDYIIVSFVVFTYLYITGAITKNMMEVVSLWCRGVAWSYLVGNISTNDF